MNWLNRLPFGVLVTAWLLVGTLLPAVRGWIDGVENVPTLMIHDEHAYLLQADTFARGRLTNPSPRHPEFFESPHILVTPSYQAKYPPGQAIFLAIGSRFLGDPVWGVWLSCGLFAGALYWMLAAWTNRLWAMLGTVHSVTVAGIGSYWAQSYWGGMVAALGGALVLGGTRWTLRQWKPVHGFLIGLGTVVLACSRPYEGGCVCLACAPILAWWLLGGSTQERLRKLIGWCGPFALVVAAGCIGMAEYNQAVTGNWKTLPYALHQKQYFTCGLFRWQPIERVPARRLATHVRAFYEGGPHMPRRMNTGLIPAMKFGLNNLLELPRQFVIGVRFRWSKLQSYVSLVVVALFLVLDAWFLCTTKRWGLLQAAWIVLILEGLAATMVWWNSSHYMAPVVCLWSFILVDWIRRVCVSFRRTALRCVLRPSHFIIAFSVLVTPSVLVMPLLNGLLAPSPWKGADSTLVSPSFSYILSQSQLVEKLSHEERPVLVFVSYDPAVGTEDEWVYNLADLGSQRVVLAHDLGPEHNRQLIADFPGRDMWRVWITENGGLLQIYNAAGISGPGPLRPSP